MYVFGTKECNNGSIRHGVGHRGTQINDDVDTVKNNIVPLKHDKEGTR